ncbi:DUF2735 domain-containing protein [Rhodopseudomonas sp. P2A-2r]|uniref:DUF2735 domain-containing protein n=1 Tax=unclassified Rhodopseudomonas TaxID=2638247 RepID=UPI0022345486|nr:DUF2735 domain-containing protein [Rhodopseudomonas sp. P2A-2r]UZE46758.1 DUF2735 domain-containing protein [Rhodopseudomonas sp. P2A-2r]
MTTGFFTGSAKIYQFPVRPRAAAGFRNHAQPAQIAAPSICTEAFGSWYHEQAIQDDRRETELAREH